MHDARHSRPATRLLALLELLQNHRQLSGGDIAARLAITGRSVRRYIAQLEELGIPILTTRGPAGGYALVPGYKLPPLMFNNDETLALALGLAAVRNLAPETLPQAATAAQAKLERVMPAPVKSRLQSIARTVSLPRTGAHTGSTALLPQLSDCAHAGRGVHMLYRDPAGRETGRDFDPYALALCRGQWYVAGYCHLRRALRTFRMDRITGLTEQQRSFHRAADFDIQAHLARSIATLPRTHSIEVRLHTSLDAARSYLAPELGILEAGQHNRTLLRSQADDLEWFARELARMPWRFEVVSPKQLRTALRRHARRLAAMAAKRLKIPSKTSMS